MRRLLFLLAFLAAPPVAAQVTQPYWLGVVQPGGTVPSGMSLVIGSSLPANVQDYGAKGDSTTPSQPGIQAALSSGNNTVFVPSGNYLLNKSLIFTKSNVTLRLAAGARLVFTGTDQGAALTDAPTGGAITTGIVVIGDNWLSSQIVVQVANVHGITIGSDSRVANLTLIGTNAAGSGSGINSGSALRVVIDHVRISKWSTHGINTGGGNTDWQITNNFIDSSFAGGGILIGAVSNSSSGFLIQGNHIISVCTNGIDVNGFKQRILGNEVRGAGVSCGANATDRWGIDLQSLTGADANDNLIEHNRVVGSRNQNIIIRSVTGQNCNRNIIANNQADSSTTFDGIATDGTSAGTFSENLIIGNLSQGNARDGIRIDGASSTNLQFTLVQSNSSFDNVGNGVFVSGTTVTHDTYVLNNWVFNNTAGQVTLNGGSFPTRTTIVGNRENNTGTEYEVNAGTLRVGGQANSVKRLDLYGYSNGIGSGTFASIYGDITSSGVLNIQPIGGAIYKFDGTATGGGGFQLPVREQTKHVALTCGSATTPALDASLGNFFTCNITSNVAVVVAVPTNAPPAGQSQTVGVALRNSSGGAFTTAPTFNTGAGGFKFGAASIVNPTNGTQVLYEWTWDPVQSFWYETDTPVTSPL